jgi:hypothetical protein
LSLHSAQHCDSRHYRSYRAIHMFFCKHQVQSVEIRTWYQLYVAVTTHVYMCTTTTVTHIIRVFVRRSSTFLLMHSATTAAAASSTTTATDAAISAAVTACNLACVYKSIELSCRQLSKITSQCLASPLHKQCGINLLHVNTVLLPPIADYKCTDICCFSY